MAENGQFGRGERFDVFGFEAGQCQAAEGGELSGRKRVKLLRAQRVHLRGREGAEGAAAEADHLGAVDDGELVDRQATNRDAGERASWLVLRLSKSSVCRAPI